MTYTLVTPKGKIYTFTIKSCADIFQQAYGGTLVTDEILSKEIKNESIS